MSVLYSTATGWVISHENFIKNTYKKVSYNVSANVTLNYSKSLFHILTPFMFNAQAQSTECCEILGKKGKRKKNMNTLDDLEEKNLNEYEVTDIRHKANNLIQNAQAKGILCLPKNEEMLSKNNLDARFSANTFFNELSEQNILTCNGGNCNDYAIIVNCHGQDFVFPPGSRFYCCDINEFPSKIEFDQVYDLILMDPPWWNKYIRRKKSKNEASGYKMMYNSDLQALPIGSMLAQEGLVAVWCTNSPRHIQDLVNKIFPTWGIQYVATWFWIKVTRGGQPVCSFSKPPGKQPYERIIFGSKGDRKKKYVQPEDKKCIISVPSSVHSHKPPLTDILAHYLPPSPRCLELFARYLLPYWTSCGNQVLSLQNMKLFTKEPVIVEESH